MRVIEAAGGLLWRDSAGFLEVMLVHRPRYDDWTLPIGRLEPKEPIEVCALREVAEETGLQCKLGAYLGALEVEAGDGLHRFHIFAMQPIAGRFVANPETDQSEWLPIQEAMSRATYENVRNLLGRAAELLA